jgi:putative photosynthetic complex assembly protein
VGRVALPAATSVTVLQLRFEDQKDGGIQVRDAVRGDVIHVVQPGTGGFIRATVRTLAQARMRDNISAETPFRLTRWSDGTLSLEDEKTSRNIGLDAFGPSNAGAFAQLIQDRENIR